MGRPTTEAAKVKKCLDTAAGALSEVEGMLIQSETLPMFERLRLSTQAAFLHSGATGLNNQTANVFGEFKKWANEPLTGADQAT